MLSVMLCSIDVTICLFQLKPPCTIKRRLVVTMVHNSFKSGSSKMPDFELPSQQQTACKCVDSDVIMMLQSGQMHVQYDAPKGLFMMINQPPDPFGQ